MATKRPPPKPERPKHSIPEKRADIHALETRIREVEAFDPGTVTRRYGADDHVNVLQTAIDETLADVFGKDTDDYRRYADAADMDDGPPPIMRTDWDRVDEAQEAAEAQRYAAGGKKRALALLTQAVRRLKEEITREESMLPAASAASAGARAAVAAPPSRRIFIVHGHDEGMRESVARFIEHLDFQPVILHEQPNRGRTLIEKFEAHGETAGFAVVLMSPDDEGRAKNADRVAARARQNVVLELGYFVGKLGRSCVCALKRGDLEMPSDVVGVVYTGYDDAGAWKRSLAEELQAAGYTIDWNKVMSR